MINIGKRLKDRRNELRKSLEEVNEQTKITVEHLTLLEQSDFKFLPATYVKSFIRDYARALDLDDQELLNQYEQTQEKEKRQEKEREEDYQIENEQSPGKQKMIEWALGVGLLILLISTILIYFEYKSQVYAEPIDPFQGTNQMTNELAKISIQHPLVIKEGEVDGAMELQIIAKRKVWLQITIDSTQQDKVTLLPAENRKWQADSRFDIVIGKWIENEEGSDSQQASVDEEVRFSLTKEALQRPSQQ